MDTWVASHVDSLMQCTQQQLLGDLSGWLHAMCICGKVQHDKLSITAWRGGGVVMLCEILAAVLGRMCTGHE
jgi:hypothetical protein